MRRSYTVEVRSAPIPQLDDDVAESFAESILAEKRLAGAVPSADLAMRVLELRTGVDATTFEDAMATAIAAFERAIRRRFASAEAEIVDASVWLDDGSEYDRRELLSGADIADRLGISRQRIAQLVAEEGRFPRPAATFGTVSVWAWGDVADWIAAGGRGDAHRMTADAAALAFSLTGRRETTRSPELREAMLERLIYLANSGEKVAAEHLEKIPAEAFFDGRMWVRQVDSGRGSGVAVGRDRDGRARIVRTRR